MTKLRLQPEQESHWVHCQCHCPKELHQQKQPLHHSFGLYSSQLTSHRSFSIKVTRRIESQSQRHSVAYISAVGYEPDRSGACNRKAFKLLLLIFYGFTSSSFAAGFWNFGCLCNLGSPFLTAHVLIVHSSWTTSLPFLHFFNSNSRKLLGSQGASFLLSASGRRTFLPLLLLLFPLANFH